MTSRKVDGSPLFVDHKGHKADTLSLVHPFVPLNFELQDVDKRPLMSSVVFDDPSQFAVSCLNFTIEEDLFNQMARHRSKESLDVRVRVSGNFNSDTQLYAIVTQIGGVEASKKREIVRFAHRCQTIPELLDESTGSSPSVYLLTIEHVKCGTVIEIGTLVPSSSEIVGQYEEFCRARTQRKDYQTQQRIARELLAKAEAEAAAAALAAAIAAAENDSEASFSTPVIERQARSDSKSTIRDLNANEFEFATNIHSIQASFCESDVEFELADNSPVEVHCALAYNPRLHQLRQLRTFRRFHLKMEGFIRHTYGNLCGDAYMSRVQSAACKECRDACTRYEEGTVSVARSASLTEGLNLGSSIITTGSRMNDVPTSSSAAVSQVLEAMSRTSAAAASSASAAGSKTGTAANVESSLKASVTATVSRDLSTVRPDGDATTMYGNSKANLKSTAAIDNDDDPAGDYLSNKPFYCLKPDCAGRLIDCDYRNPRYLAHLIDGLVGPYAGQSLVDSGIRFHRIRWRERDKLMESRFDKLELFYEEKFYYELQLDKFVCPRCHRIEPYLDARFRKLCIAQQTNIEYESECVNCKVVFEPEHVFRMQRWEKRMNAIEMVRTKRLQNLQETQRRIESYRYVPYQFHNHPHRHSRWAPSSSRRVTQYRKILQCDGSTIDWAKVFANSQEAIDKRRRKSNHGLKGILKQPQSPFQMGTPGSKAGITFGTVGSSSSSSVLQKSSVERMSILNMINGVLDSSPGAVYGRQTPTLDDELADDDCVLDDAAAATAAEGIVVNVSVVESVDGDPHKEDPDVDFELLRVQQQATEMAVATTPRDTVVPALTGTAPAGPADAMVEVQRLTPSETEEELQARRDRRNDIGLYGSGNHAGGDVIYFATEEEAIGKLVQAVRSATPNILADRNKDDIADTNDDIPTESEPLTTTQELTAATVTKTESPTVAESALAIDPNAVMEADNIDVRSIDGNMSPLMRASSPTPESRFLRDADSPAVDIDLTKRDSEPKKAPLSRKTSVSSAVSTGSSREPGTNRRGTNSHSSNNYSPSRSPSKKRHHSTSSRSSRGSSDSVGGRRSAAFLEDNEDEEENQFSRGVYASYFWVSGIAGVVPPNAVLTGTTVDNGVHNNYSEAPPEYEDDCEENIIQSFTVRVRCMYHTESNTLEEYDLNKMHLYSLHRNHYMERYFMGVCRRGSNVKAMCMVPSSMKLGANLTAVDCFENRDQVLPESDPLHESASRVEPFAMAQIVEDNEDEYGEGEDCEDDEADPMAAACALINQSTNTSSSQDSPAKHKTAVKTNNAFVTICLTRCEYLVEALTPVGKPEPSEASVIQMSKSTFTQPKESIFSQLKESAILPPADVSDVFFDDSLVFEDDSTVFAKLSLTSIGAGALTTTETAAPAAVSEPEAATASNILQSGSIGIADVTEDLQRASSYPSLYLSKSHMSTASMVNSVTSRKSAPPPTHVTQQWDDHFQKLDTPSLLLSNAILLKDFGNSNQVRVETCAQKKLNLSTTAKYDEGLIKQRFTWLKAEPNWLGSANVLHLPKDCMFVANILSTGNNHHTNKNKFKSNPVEYVFVVRTMLHNVNIVSGTFIYKKPVIVNRGLLSRLSFMLTSNHSSMIAGMGSGGAFGNMSYASAIEAALNAQSNRKVEQFTSSVGKDKDKPKVHYCTKVTTVIEHPTTAAAAAAGGGAGASTTNNHSSDGAALTDTRSSMNLSTTSNSTNGGGIVAATTSEEAKNTQQVTEIIGPLDHGLLAVFYFNNCLYYVPIKDVEFLCICKI